MELSDVNQVEVITNCKRNGGKGLINANALVIGSQYGSCTVAPQPVAVEVEEEAVKEEPVAEEKAEEAKEEEPKDGAE